MSATNTFQFINFGICEDEMVTLCNRDSEVASMSNRIEEMAPINRVSIMEVATIPNVESTMTVPDVVSSTPAVVGKAGPSEIQMCPTCHKVFTLKRNLTRHLKTHTGETSFTCDICQKSFSRKSDLNRHERIHQNNSRTLQCNTCNKTFTREDNLLAHMKTHSQTKTFSCTSCNATFSKKSNLTEHIRILHRTPPPVSMKRKTLDVGSTSSKRARRSRKALEVFLTETLEPSEENSADLMLCLEELRPHIENLFLTELETRQIKWYAMMNVRMSRINSDGEEEFAMPHFRSSCVNTLQNYTVGEHVNSAIAKIMESVENFYQRGSGWTLDRVLNVEMYLGTYRPLRPSSFIPLPPKIKAKKAVLNIQNEDQKCFIWCVLAHWKNIDFTNNSYRVSHYMPFEGEVDMGNVECPVAVSKIPTLERLNECRINVFGYEKGEVFPLLISEREDSDVINLLLISDGVQQHYCLIRDFSRLLGDLTLHDGQTFICYRCLHRFCREELLQTHIPYCKEHAPQRVSMPSLDKSILKFNMEHYQHPVPFIIYADFEALLVKMDSSEPSRENSFTEKVALHEPCGYAYVVIDPQGKCLKDPKVYRGSEAVIRFVEDILREKDELAPKIKANKKMKMTRSDYISFDQALECYLCKKPFKRDGAKFVGKCRDHDHMSGAYRGALHVACNLKFRLPTTIPVVFHNLKNYDGHHLMTGLGQFKDYEINPIAVNMEKYLSFSILKKGDSVRLHFIDSLQFLNTSLQKLVENLPRSEFNITSAVIPEHTDLLLRKGVYPYEYMDSYGKFEDCTLPPPSAFFSTLTQEEIRQEDYAHAQNVWRAFDLKNMGQYHDLYVKTDVLLLADVFQHFRKLCMAYYGLDCAHLMTAPGLAWQAALKMVDQPLDLLTDLDMHLFVERGIRGGISVITKRWARANNPYMTEYVHTSPPGI